MKYYVQFCVPMKEPDCQRGFYVFTTTNLAKAMAFAEREAQSVVCPGGLFEVLHPDTAAILQQFPCK